MLALAGPKPKSKTVEAGRKASNCSANVRDGIARIVQANPTAVGWHGTPALPNVPEIAIWPPAVPVDRYTPLMKPQRRRKEPSWRTEVRHLKRVNQQARLALFIGAGISHGCGLPGWDPLVQTLAVAAYQGGKASVRDAMTNFNTVVQGRILKTRLKDRFNKAVADAIYASPYEISPALNAIVSAGARQICTYNFDDLIEEALGIQSIPFQSLMPGNALNADFTGTTVFHPHGFLTASMTAEECASTGIVLSEEDYHGLYANPYSWANLIQLSLLLSHSCLFVGASLTDPSIRRLLDICVALPIAHLHYAIFLTPVAGLDGHAKKAAQDLQVARNSELRSLGVRPIWINNFDEIETIFRRISVHEAL